MNKSLAGRLAALDSFGIAKCLRPCDMCPPRPVASLASDADFGLRARVVTRPRIVSLDIAGGVTVGVAGIPVFVGTSPMKRITVT